MSRADGNRLEQQEKMQIQSDAMIGLLTDRGIVWLFECFPENVASELDKPFEGGVDTLLEQVDLEVSWGTGNWRADNYDTFYPTLGSTRY